MNIEPRYHKDDTTYNIRGYIDYMNGVLSGDIVANEYIRLACERMRSWFDRDDIYYDVADVDRRINFIYKLKQTSHSSYYSGSSLLLQIFTDGSGSITTDESQEKYF